MTYQQTAECEGPGAHREETRVLRPTEASVKLLERFRRCLVEKAGDVNPFDFFRTFERELDRANAQWLLAEILEVSVSFLDEVDAYESGDDQGDAESEP